MLIKLFKYSIVFVVLGFQVLLYLIFAALQAGLIAIFSYVISEKLFYPVFFISFVICAIYHIYNNIVTLFIKKSE
ncbi:hypothetical protein [Caloramator australicus]|uniref:hypothetical protein n=1 Tax=Caloramator australicus TaxID=515264 RepID=UPI00058E2AEC|nr:hypothetical protein [Caloramator australicus]